VYYRAGGIGFDIDRLYAGVGGWKEGFHGESGPPVSDSPLAAAQIGPIALDA
jgi:hypothetical protein